VRLRNGNVFNGGIEVASPVEDLAKDQVMTSGRSALQTQGRE